jgi:phosphatidylglycerol:prolipoprotein diacylglycerol transferase
LVYYYTVFASAYLHKLDPFAIQLTDTVGLRWYGLAYIAGFITAWFAIRWMGTKKITQIQPNRVGDFMFACVIGVLLGGRLGYCLFYDPSLFITFTDSFPWWKVLAIQDGGMASHGGILGVLIAVVVWGKKNKISVLHLFDISAIFATPGLFFGRIANFINGELWGKPLSEAQQQNPPWWSVKYPAEITEVWVMDPDNFNKQLSGVDTLQSQIVSGTSFYNSVVQEIYSGNQLVIETAQPLLTAWYPSQLFQALSEGPILFFALFAIWWKPKNPGVIAGWFLIIYGVLRVATEIFRQPDEGVALLLGLSRGQVLSTAMVLCGVLLAFTSSVRRDTQKLGGFSVPLKRQIT